MADQPESQLGGSRRRSHRQQGAERDSCNNTSDNNLNKNRSSGKVSHKGSSKDSTEPDKIQKSRKRVNKESLEESTSGAGFFETSECRKFIEDNSGFGAKPKKPKSKIPVKTLKGVNSCLNNQVETTLETLSQPSGSGQVLESSNSKSTKKQGTRKGFRSSSLSESLPSSSLGPDPPVKSRGKRKQSKKREDFNCQLASELCWNNAGPSSAAITGPSTEDSQAPGSSTVSPIPSKRLKTTCIQEVNIEKDSTFLKTSPKKTRSGVPCKPSASRSGVNRVDNVQSGLKPKKTGSCASSSGRRSSAVAKRQGVGSQTSGSSAGGTSRPLANNPMSQGQSADNTGSSGGSSTGERDRKSVV